MKGSYHIWAWGSSWSCDLDFLYIHWFPLPIDASYKIWLWLAKPRFQRRRSLTLWKDGRWTPDHGYPISSPCEPNGSGELNRGLKIACYIDVNVLSLSNLTILKADISKTSSEQYQFLFIFIFRTSQYIHMQKITVRSIMYIWL